MFSIELQHKIIEMATNKPTQLQNVGTKVRPDQLGLLTLDQQKKKQKKKASRNHPTPNL